jgi:hypothetical protein
MVESSLMVIVAMLGGVEDAANVHDDVALL